jgi:acyl transferase domain-containing protein
MQHRAFIVTDGQTFEASPITKTNSPSTASCVFVFTGQGSQWAEMGRELIHTYESFANDLETMNETLKGLEQAPSWNIRGKLGLYRGTKSPFSNSSKNRHELILDIRRAPQVRRRKQRQASGAKPAAMHSSSSGPGESSQIMGYIS